MRFQNTVVILLSLACLLSLVDNWEPTQASYDYHIDENAIYHFKEGEKWLEVERYETAISEFNIAIQLKPDSTLTATLYNDLGIAYLKTSRNTQAIRAFKQAITINPQFSLYYENLAKAYQACGQARSLIQRLKKDVAKNEEDPPSWFLLGVLYQTIGEKDLARETFETYLKIAPHAPLADAAKQALETSH
jgi:tetratricopeptide (TPR) repeat protein